jgi:hypothetical protein
VHRACDDGDGHPEEYQTKGDGKVQQERNQPAIVVAVKNEASNPPSGYESISGLEEAVQLARLTR